MYESEFSNNIIEIGGNWIHLATCVSKIILGFKFELCC